MLPLKDTVPSRTFPIANILIILINTLAFLYELQLSNLEIERFFMYYGIVPYKISNPNLSIHFSLIEKIIPFFTSMFLHGGWVHFLGNMWFLWIFGDNVEDRLGHLRYILFYILCGLSSALVHFTTNFYSTLPTIGASGAIAGVMGAYFILFPQARVITLLPIFIFVHIIEIPAFFFLGIWFIIQFYSGTLSLIVSSDGYGGVAWWAHIGGFIAGIILLPILKKRKSYRYFYRDEYFPW